MVSDDADEHRVDNGDETTEPKAGEDVPIEIVDSDAESKRAVDDVDQRIVDLLSWILETETRAKIYVHLLAQPGSTSEEVARGTGLYPSTVREALAELHDEERVTREKRASEGAGNNPYEYRAIQPSELVGGVVDQVQRELNTIFTLDRLFEREDDAAVPDDVEPVTIVVDDIGEKGDDAPDDTDDDDADDETTGETNTDHK